MLGFPPFLTNACKQKELFNAAASQRAPSSSSRYELDSTAGNELLLSAGEDLASLEGISSTRQAGLGCKVSSCWRYLEPPDFAAAITQLGQAPPDNVFGWAGSNAQYQGVPKLLAEGGKGLVCSSSFGSEAGSEGGWELSSRADLSAHFAPWPSQSSPVATTVREATVFSEQAPSGLWAAAPGKNAEVQESEMTRAERSAASGSPPARSEGQAAADCWNMSASSNQHLSPTSAASEKPTENGAGLQAPSQQGFCRLLPRNFHEIFLQGVGTLASGVGMAQRVLDLMDAGFLPLGSKGGPQPLPGSFPPQGLPKSAADSPTLAGCLPSQILASRAGPPAAKTAGTLVGSVEYARAQSGVNPAAGCELQPSAEGSIRPSVCSGLPIKQCTASRRLQLPAGNAPPEAKENPATLLPGFQEKMTRQCSERIETGRTRGISAPSSPPQRRRGRLAAQVFPGGRSVGDISIFEQDSEGSCLSGGRAPRSRALKSGGMGPPAKRHKALIGTSHPFNLQTSGQLLRRASESSRLASFKSPASDMWPGSVDFTKRGHCQQRGYSSLDSSASCFPSKHSQPMEDCQPVPTANRLFSKWTEDASSLWDLVAPMTESGSAI